jgi:hypothetical protein
MPPPSAGTTSIFGLYQKRITDFGVPIEIIVTIYEPEGDTRVLYRFKHPGGNLVFPYALKEGTELTIKAFDQVIDRQTIGGAIGN